MTPKRILITGTGGFLGSRMAAWLDRNGADKFLVIKDFPRSDLADFDVACRLVEKARPDYIFHFAGRLSADTWNELFAANVVSTLSVLSAVERLGLSTTTIVPGSAAEYGALPAEAYPLKEEIAVRPLNRYGLVKAWQTSAALSAASRGLDVRVARIFNILGRDIPQRFAVGSFAAQVRRIKNKELEPVVKVGNLEPRRDFLDLEDLMAGLVAIAEQGKAGEIYNICSERAVSMREVLVKMMQLAGVQAQIIEEPGRVRVDDIPVSQGSRQKAARDLGWQPRVSLEKAIENTLNL